MRSGRVKTIEGKRERVGGEGNKDRDYRRGVGERKRM